MAYTNKWGQEVTTQATDTGLLPTHSADGSTNGVSVPNPADAPAHPLSTAPSIPLVDQIESGRHPMAPQHPGSAIAAPLGVEEPSEIAKEIDAIENP